MSNKFSKIFAVILLLAGGGFFLYPTVREYWNDYQNQKVIDQIASANMEQEAAAAPSTDASQESPEQLTETTGATELSDMDRLYETLAEYNGTIYKDRQKGLKDPFSYQNVSIDLTEYGMESNVIGTLWIPRLDVELPLYLGANTDNMAKGAGLLGNTSMPIGGNNTNIAIAAHRGWHGSPMFRDIQKIQLGDKVQITTPWDVLIYKVCELKVILPEDVDQIKIQEGRELVTLMTCHPYTQNYQRYLVYAERVQAPVLTKEEDLKEAEQSLDSAPKQVEQINADGSVEILEISSAQVQPVAEEGQESGVDYYNLQIWLDDYGTWVVFAVVLILSLSMIIHNRKPKYKGRYNNDKT